MTEEEFKEYHDKRWKEMPEVIKLEAIAWLKENLPEHVKQKIKEKYTKNPVYWTTENRLHFSWGMIIRNELREYVCPDNKLPSGNWDDYYAQCIEAACNLREI